MEIYLPEEVKYIIKKIENIGKEAYAVGGCIRDTLLGRSPDDWDITTSAKPEEIKRIFEKTIDTGIQHGTVTVLINEKPYEVTTYRVDGNYGDGRHPDSVTFSSNLREDLRRRDFTINAMAYNDKNGLKDEFDGRKDLERRVIRCVGDPKERFSEDALRMMRAIRFSSQLGFNIEMNTYLAIIELSQNIKNVSMERVQTELIKTLLSNHPECVAEYQKTGLFIETVPLMYTILSGRKAQRTLARLIYMPAKTVMRFTAIYRDEDPNEVKAELKRLKLDNYTIDTVTHLIKYLGETIDENDIAVREAIYKYGEEYMEMMFEFEEADIALKEDATGLSMRKRRLHLRAIMRIYQDILDRGDCLSLAELAVTGGDLLEMGIKGRRIGETLDWLLHIVFENPDLNNKETLLSMVENL